MAAKHHINISLFSSKRWNGKKEIEPTERYSTRLTKQFFNESIEIRFPDELHCIELHRFCVKLPLGRERKGIGGWRGKEGTRRGDYRRHCSLCERLSLARQGGGTL